MRPWPLYLDAVPKMRAFSSPCRVQSGHAESWLHGLGAADEPGKVFFRKDFENSEPDWIPRLTLSFEDHINTYPMIDEPAGLAWFNQVAALDLGEGADFPECIQNALLPRQMFFGTI